MKSNLDKLFKNNENFESEGIWLEISDTVGFKVKRFGGANETSIKAALAKHYKPYARQIENKTLDPKKEKEILLTVFVKACVVDWKGVEIDGNATPFSPEIAIKFFTELPELAETLMTHASDTKNYREDLGNS